MNKVQDFYKRDDGVVINTNTTEYLRAKRRNYIRKKQDEMIDALDDVKELKHQVKKLGKMQNDVKEIKKMLDEIIHHQQERK